MSARNLQKLSSMNITYMSKILVLLTIITCAAALPKPNRGHSINQPIGVLPNTKSVTNQSFSPNNSSRVFNDAPVESTTINFTVQRHKDTLFQQVGFLFNQPDLEPIQPKLMSNNRPSCAKSKKQTFCNIEEVPDYPRDKIKSLVHYDREEFKNLFGMGASTGVQVTFRAHGNRIMEVTDAEDPSETNICDKTTKILFPRSARNRQNNWVYIVNDEEYIQGVTSETCRNEETPCNLLQDYLPSDFTSTCRQKYSYKKLLAVDPNKASTYTDEFPIPSCCSCYLKSSILGFSYDLKKNSTASP